MLKTIVLPGGKFAKIKSVTYFALLGVSYSLPPLNLNYIFGFTN